MSSAVGEAYTARHVGRLHVARVSPSDILSLIFYMYMCMYIYIYMYNIYIYMCVSYMRACMFDIRSKRIQELKI